MKKYTHNTPASPGREEPRVFETAEACKCDFCGRTPSEEKTVMVKGPGGACICNACVAFYSTMFESDPRDIFKKNGCELTVFEDSEKAETIMQMLKHIESIQGKISDLVFDYASFKDPALGMKLVRQLIDIQEGGPNIFGAVAGQIKAMWDVSMSIKEAQSNKQLAQSAPPDPPDIPA